MPTFFAFASLTRTELVRFSTQRLQTTGNALAIFLSTSSDETSYHSVRYTAYHTSLQLLICTSYEDSRTNFGSDSRGNEQSFYSQLINRHTLMFLYICMYVYQSTRVSSAFNADIFTTSSLQRITPHDYPEH